MSTHHVTDHAPRSDDAQQPRTGELIARLQRGDREAGEILCKRYGNRVVRLVRRFLRSRPRRKLETDDLVQSSLRELFVHLDQFNYRGEGAFICWVDKIVENKIRATLRYWSAKARSAQREEARDVNFLPQDGPTPSQEIHRTEEKEFLYRAIERLPDRQRRVVINRMLLELPWAAIARADDTTERAAQMLLNRARKQLAEELRKLRAKE